MKRISRIALKKFSAADELDNIKSLFYSYRNITDINKEQRQLHNMKLITEDTKITSGHITNITNAQKARIDTLANNKLKELEDSGLSREELLDLPDKGIKLGADPFFQLIKSDIKARHRLLSKANVEYTVDNIVKFALSQDVGYDRAASGSGRRIKTEEDEYNQDRDGMLANTHKYKHVEPEDYYKGASEPLADEYKKKSDLDSLKPIKSVRKTKKVVIDPLDIHWRNTELLVKFMTRFSTIKHRRYTGLSTQLHKKIERTIKHSRKLNLIGNQTYMKPQYSVPLRTLLEDADDDKFYEIDVETGTIHRENVYEPRDYKNETFRIQLNFFDKEKIIRGEESKDVELLRNAKEYLRQLKMRALNRDEFKARIVPDIVAAEIEMKFKPMPEDKLEELKKSYDEFKAKYQNISFNDLAELIVAEINEDVDTLEHFKEFSAVAKHGIVPETYEELLDQLNTLKQSIGYDDPEFIECAVEKEVVRKLQSSEAS